MGWIEHDAAFGGEEGCAGGREVEEEGEEEGDGGRPKSALTPGPSPGSPRPIPGRGEKGRTKKAGSAGFQPASVGRADRAAKDGGAPSRIFFLSPLSRRGRGWEMGEG